MGPRERPAMGGPARLRRGAATARSRRSAADNTCAEADGAKPPGQETMMPRPVVLLLLVSIYGISVSYTLARAQGQAVSPLASRIDPYVEKQRVVVMTDIANEPDDQMSIVRFLVYSNRFDVEGLVATTSTWMKNRVRPDVLQTLVRAYEEVWPRLSQHEA